MRNRPFSSSITLRSTKDGHRRCSLFDTPRPPGLTIESISKHRLLASYLHEYFLAYQSALSFSPLTIKLLASLPSLTFVPAFLQAYTLCRVGELKQILFTNIKENESFIIHSSKSSHVRTIPAFFRFNYSSLQRISHDTPLFVISYDHLRNSISAACRNINLPYVTGILDKTHIFRHLQASHFHFEGVDIDEISKRLGHLSNKTTYSYLHKEFFV